MVSKYRSRKTTVGAIVFDSAKEARRWEELCLLERAGHIAELERQVSYELAPSVKFDGAKRAKPALRYVADFRYTVKATGLSVIEDTKGFSTREYEIKRHLMKAVHGLEIKDGCKR